MPSRITTLNRTKIPNLVRIFSLALVSASLVGFGVASTPARAEAIFDVDTTADTVDTSPGDDICADSGGQCSLRAAIMEANALVGDDVIIVPAGTYTLTIAGSGEDLGATGDLDITDKVTLIGAGADITIIDGNGTDRVFDIAYGVTAVFNYVTITNGDPGAG